MQVTDAMVREAAIAIAIADGRNLMWPVYADHAKAALTAALAEMWQDIGTAPKDGRPGILFSPYDEDMNCKGGLIWTSGGFGKGAIHPEWRGETNKEPPTHFMPLPAPPKTGGE